MNIYRWDSSLLKQYYEGDLIVCASSPDEARNILRSNLKQWIKEFRTYEYDLAFPSDEEQEPDLEEYNALVQKFEHDIFVEPEIHQQLWIFGSE